MNTQSALNSHVASERVDGNNKTTRDRSSAASRIQPNRHGMSMKATSLTLVAAALVATFPASAESIAPLTWRACGATTIPSGDVAARTECSSLLVPRDYANPGAGTISLDIIRVAAAGERGERHDGTLLLEPDEFADTIDRSVPAMASGWLSGDESWRKVARRLDLVGLAPRRMDDADGRDCVSATRQLPRYASLGTDTSFTNFMVAEDLARAIATACQNDPMHAHIGMRPRIQDMDRLREALGQSKLHLLGIGRGGWVATRYAERYPQNVGRMLLDGSWDADGSVAEAVEARVHERGRTIRRVISALIAAPDRYSWGTDANVIHQQLGKMPSSVYSAWIRSIASVDDLSAALALGRLLERDAAMSTQGLRSLLPTMQLATDVDGDRAVRSAAARLLKVLDAERNGNGDPYGFGAHAVGLAPALVATAFAARCNDGAWGTSHSYWRERTRELHVAWPSGVDNETFQGMVCSEWPGAFGPTSVPVLDQVPSFLMLHAEFDDEAPLRNAAMMLQGHGNASMVVARGLRAHGVIARTDRPCVSAAASQFLADGTLPSVKLTNCRLPTSTP
jgi:pimeloyl-ACP methyl ester carboxylesterase